MLRLLAKGSLSMKPETQELLADIISFSHRFDWELTFFSYREEMENPDLWSSFDKEMMKKVFAHTKNEDHRMKACDYLIKNNASPIEMIDLLYDYSDLVFTKSGERMIIYLSCLVSKIDTEYLKTFFELIFSMQSSQFEEISIKIADEVSKRHKPIL